MASLDGGGRRGADPVAGSGGVQLCRVFFVWRGGIDIVSWASVLRVTASQDS